MPLLDVDWLGHSGSFPVNFLMLGPGRLQLPHNAMTKLGQDVVHLSHHSPSPLLSIPAMLSCCYLLAASRS